MVIKLKNKKPSPAGIGLEEKLSMAEATNKKLAAEVQELSQLVHQRNDEISLLNERLNNLACDMVDSQTGEVVKAVFSPAGQLVSWAEIKGLISGLMDNNLNLYQQVLIASFLVGYKGR